MFRNSFIVDQANPRIQRAWREDGRKGYPPYGALTKLWKQEHCSQLDPYGNDTCPYRREDCVLAYMKTAIDAVEHHPDNVVAYFGQLARWRGAERADNKPLARYNSRTDGHKGRSPSVRTGSRERPVDDLSGLDEERWGPTGLSGLEGDGEGLRGTARRFFSVGELFGRTDLRPHLDPRRWNQGEASADHDGDRDVHLPDPSPVESLGDEQSPPTTGVPEESQ